MIFGSNRICGLRMIALAVLGAAMAILASAHQAVPAAMDDPPSLEPAVTYLAKAPEIDGRLDEALRSLPLRRFPILEKSRVSNPVREAGYRLAYGTEFLYVFIEVDKPAWTARDRGYQNGDGCHLVLTLPRPDGAASREFYVLGFTPTADPARRWQRQFVWYRNVDVIMRPLGRSRFRECAEGGKAFFEILIPWADVYPYHPWLCPALGFNLCLVEAIGESEHNEHVVLADGNIQSELRPRLSVRLAFEPPAAAEGIQAYAVLERNNIRQGEPVSIRTAILSPGRKSHVLRYAWEPRPAVPGRGALLAPPSRSSALAQASKEAVAAIMNPNSYGYMSTLMDEARANPNRRLSFKLRPGLEVFSRTIEPGRLKPGLYTIELEGGLPALNLSVLPAFDGPALARLLEANAGNLAPSSLSTLQFHLADVERNLRALRPYDAPMDLHVLAAALAGAIKDAERGLDAVARDFGPGRRRRAYRSTLDGTLQPYTLMLPADYSPDRAYPLLVWLHGSGQDDRSIPSGVGAMAPEAIVLAPFGRGTSNLFVRNHAQDDIREALADVLANFPVDRGKIFLGGFSMGGYGTYRTYFENPRPWRGLIVWAGHPSLWQADIDFLDEANLRAFSGTDIFIYHGAEDRNCPSERTRELAAKLKTAGATVEFHLEPGKGHEGPGQATLKAAAAWLKERTGA